IRVHGARVTASVFNVLATAPSMGRGFTQADDVDGAAPVAVITDAFWRNQFNAYPNVIAKAVRIEGQDTPIIGVLPAGFRFHFSDNEPQVYLTCVFTPDVMTAVQIHSGAGFLTYIGRLRPGATFEQARADLAAIDSRYAKEHASYVDATMFGLHLDPLIEDVVGRIRPTLNILLGAVLFLFLIACGNVAHLLLERANARRREVAVRLAGGGSYVRVLRQFVSEALLLAFAGCVLGIVFSRAIVTILVSHGPANIPRLADTTPDARVIGFAAV